jgi:hypothetical protein
VAGAPSGRGDFSPWRIRRLRPHIGVDTAQALIGLDDSRLARRDDLSRCGGRGSCVSTLDSPWALELRAARAARVVAAGGGIEATGLRTRENVLRLIDPAILDKPPQRRPSSRRQRVRRLASAAGLLSLRPHAQAVQARCPLGAGLLARGTARLSQSAGTATRLGCSKARQLPADDQTLDQRRDKQSPRSTNRRAFASANRSASCRYLRSGNETPSRSHQSGVSALRFVGVVGVVGYRQAENARRCYGVTMLWTSSTSTAISAGTCP